MTEQKVHPGSGVIRDPRPALEADSLGEKKLMSAQVESGDASRDDLDRLAAMQPHSEIPPGIDVEVEESDRKIMVFGKHEHSGDRVIMCEVRWLPQGQRFRIYQRFFIGPDKTEQCHETAKGTWHDAWNVLGNFGVGGDIFCQAFAKITPPVGWNFQACPFDRTDCNARPHGNPAGGGQPELKCVTCATIFLIHEDGKLSISDLGSPPEAA